MDQLTVHLRAGIRAQGSIVTHNKNAPASQVGKVKMPLFAQVCG